MIPTFDLLLEIAPGQESSPFYWKIPKGDTRVARFKFLFSGQLVNLTGYDIRLTGKRCVYDSTPLFQVTGSPDTVPTSALIELATALGTPVNGTFSLGAGSLPAGTYSYRISALDFVGETLASVETSFTIDPGDAPAGIVVTWGGVAGATSYKVYGRTIGEQLLATVSAPTLTWLDDGSSTPATSSPAPTDTTGIEPGTYFAAVTIDTAATGQFTLTGTIAIENHA